MEVKQLSFSRLKIYEGKTHYNIEYAKTGLCRSNWRYCWLSLRNGSIERLSGNKLKIKGILVEVLWIEDENRYYLESKERILEKYNIEESDFEKIPGKLWFKDTYKIRPDTYYAKEEDLRELIITSPWTFEETKLGKTQ